MVTPMVIPAAIGALLLLIGIVLFVVDLNVTSHGLPTAGGIVALLAGGLVLLWAGVPTRGCCSVLLWSSRCSWGVCSSG
jgi:membrane-bound ClpP family serine protease